MHERSLLAADSSPTRAASRKSTRLSNPDEESEMRRNKALKKVARPDTSWRLSRLRLPSRPFTAKRDAGEATSCGLEKRKKEVSCPASYTTVGCRWSNLSVLLRYHFDPASFGLDHSPQPCTNLTSTTPVGLLRPRFRRAHCHR
ncbi:hypothetical protein MRX96_017658 [Rhipicephalus microplus]